MVKQSLVSGTIDQLFKAALSSSSSPDDHDPLSPQYAEALVSPSYPEELSKWIESNNISSQKLNPQHRQLDALSREEEKQQQQQQQPATVTKLEEQKVTSGYKPTLRHVSNDKRDSN